MTKQDAIRIFGTTVTELARALGVTRSAVSQWPETLRQEQQDRVVGAAVRLGRVVPDLAPLPAIRLHDSDEPASRAA